MSPRNASTPAAPRAATNESAAEAWIAAGAAPLAPPRGRLRWALALLAALLAFGVYLGALDAGFVDWDDTGVLLENPNWRGLGPTQLAWMFTSNHYGHYQPVTWLTYGLDHVLWGMEPGGYHLTNNLFHAANAFLVFWLALALLRRGFVETIAWRDALLPWAAFLAAGLFAAHPLRVESVAWATERRDLVSAFFLLLTLLAYLRAVAPGRPGRAGWYAATLGLYVVSMLAKVGGAPLPIVLLVIDWYPLRRIPFDPRRWLAAPARRVLLEKLPFLVIALGFSFATVAQQTDRWLIPFEQHDLGARTAQAFYGLAWYAWRSLVPAGLSPLYELRMPLDPYAPRFIVSALLVAATAIVAWLLRRRLPGLAAALLVYAAMLGPLLGFFQNGPQIVADRYSYLSTLGLGLLLAAGLFALLLRPDPERVRRAPFAAVAATLLVALGVATLRQVEHWSDSRTLWARVLALEPDGSYGNNSWGYLLLEEGRVEEAIPHFRAALASNIRNREAHLNLWRALEENGATPAERYEAYRDSGRSGQPDLVAESAYRLGNIALGARHDEEAISLYRQSLELREASARTHSNLAIALMRLERYDEANVAYRRAIEIEPDLFNARIGLGDLLYRMERSDLALPQYERAMALRPDHARARQMVELLRRQRGAGSAPAGPEAP